MKIKNIYRKRKVVKISSGAPNCGVATPQSFGKGGSTPAEREIFMS